MAELGAFFGNPNLQRQGAKARALAERRDVNTLADPRTYAAVQGLLGTAPDQMGFSVLHPDYEKIKKVAEPAFALGLLGQAAPALAPLTKGLPVGASILDVGKSASKSIVRAGNPIQSAVVLIGDKIFTGRTHTEAFNRAIYEGVVRKEGGKFIYPKNAEVNSDLFMTKDGQIIDRIQASKMFDIGASETAIKEGLMQNKPASSMTVDSYIEQAEKLKKQKKSAPRQEALDTAQKNAALPIEKGGLGLPKDNTPEMRAEAMGAIDAVHFSRRGGDYTELDSGKFAIAPFDAVGTHVGTPQAAMERFQNTVGYKVNNPNYALDELTGSSYPVKVLGDKPLLNQNGMPWGEDDLNTFLRKTGGHNYSDINGGKLTYQDLNADLRKKLFDEQGYTSIPYFNEVEGKGSVSYIVPPKNIRSQFAAFDPMRRDETDILAGLLPLGLLADEEKRKEIQSLLE
jgi:hypothetical protein